MQEDHTSTAPRPTRRKAPVRSQGLTSSEGFSLRRAKARVTQPPLDFTLADTFVPAFNFFELGEGKDCTSDCSFLGQLRQDWRRKQLIVPCDVELSADDALRLIDEAKPRYRAAHRQVARPDHPRLLQIIVNAFSEQALDVRLWPMPAGQCGKAAHMGWTGLTVRWPPTRP